MEISSTQGFLFIISYIGFAYLIHITMILLGYDPDGSPEEGVALVAVPAFWPIAAPILMLVMTISIIAEKSENFHRKVYKFGQKLRNKL